MEQHSSLVIYHHRRNRYSFNALVGALEQDSAFDDLEIVPAETERLFLSAIAACVQKGRRTYGAVSFFTSQLKNTATLVERVRRQHGRGIVLLAGGPHPTGKPEEALSLGFDAVVRGEGEKTLQDLLKALDGGNNPGTVPGVVIREDSGRIRFGGRQRPVDLNAYPPIGANHAMHGPLEITRGCPFACPFCQTPYIFRGPVRHRSVEQVAAYAGLMRQRGLGDMRFITPNAFSYGSPDGRKADPAKIEELLFAVSRVVKPGGRIFFGSFPSEVRPEHVTPETIALLKEYADNDNIVIGAQSGSPRMLDLCRRGHTVHEVYEAVDLTVAAGLEARVDVIFGLPGETPEDEAATIAMMDRLARMGARIHGHAFMPLPQTPFAGAAPGKITPRLRRALNDLRARGALYGAWAEQARKGSPP